MKTALSSNTGQVQLAHVVNTGTITIGLPDPREALPEKSTEKTEASPPAAVPDPVKVQLKDDEGLRLFPYSCSPEKGTFTIGYGRNLSTNGITPGEADMMFETDFTEARTDIEQLFGKDWEGIPEDIQGVLTNMRYQLGPGGFRSFTDMIAGGPGWRLATHGRGDEKQPLVPKNNGPGGFPDPDR